MVQIDCGAVADRGAALNLRLLQERPRRMDATMARRQESRAKPEVGK